MRRLLTFVLLSLAGPSCTCGGAGPGMVRVDGSSTVLPIHEAVAEEFEATNAGRVTVGVSGTGGGMQKFCNGEIDVAGASRPIRDVELAACRDQGVAFIEVPVAYDGVVVVVHPDNDWANTMTVEELRRLWEPAAQGQVTRWSQVRAGWPDAEIRLYGAGIDSGTYDYFTSAIVGIEHTSRGDFTSSEDDNVLVQGVRGDVNALGFFGYAYYANNRDALKALAIDDGDPTNGTEAVLPSVETIASGQYQPLSRPLFAYVRVAAAEREEVDAFMRFYLGNASRLVAEVGYIGLPEEVSQLALARYAAQVTGSLFEQAGSQVGIDLVEALQR